MHLPLNAADTTVVLLLVFAALFLNFGFSQSHTGYILLGAVEIVLAVLQFAINRKDRLLS